MGPMGLIVIDYLMGNKEDCNIVEKIQVRHRKVENKIGRGSDSGMQAKIRGNGGNSKIGRVKG